MERFSRILHPVWRLLSLPGIRYLTILLVAAAVILPGIAAMPVTDRDEARFAQASKQMLETGDLIDIRFQDQPRWKKPVGIYWLQAASASVFGGTEAPIWAYRLPSAIAALLTALLMAWAARPFVGRKAALISSLILSTCVLFAVEANIAKTDATLMLTGVIVLGALGRLLLPEAHGKWRAALFLWLALAAAILIKGPIVPLIALLSVAGLVLLTRHWPPLDQLRAAWGLPLMLVLIAPWLVAIWIVSDGRFFTESIGNDLLGKVAEGKEKHWGPPGLYTLLVWVTFWPWASFLPLALPWLWHNRHQAWLAMLAAWVIPFWLIIEAVPTKLPHYVLPLYPAIAMMLAAWMINAPLGPHRRWQQWASALLVGLPGLVLGAALLIGPLVIMREFIWQAAALAIPALIFAFIAFRAALAGNRFGHAAAGILTALFLYPAILQFGLPSLTIGFPSPRIAEAAGKWRSCAEGPLVTAGYNEPSLTFLTETDTTNAAPETVAKLLSSGADRVFLIEDRWWPLIDPSLPDGRPEMTEREVLEYFNYNRGDYEVARIWTNNNPRWNACE
ncbi:glycosyltransferase family 39 protein [Rhodobacteraceae bacterium NNCM2]|nr:glycosyltransferase family 39 protein [Coraliihabitans acroporae]